MILSLVLLFAVAGVMIVLFRADLAESNAKAAAARAAEEVRNQNVALGQQAMLDAQIPTAEEIAREDARVAEFYRIATTDVNNPGYSNAVRALTNMGVRGPWNTQGPTDSGTGQSKTYGNVATGMQGGSPGAGPGSSGTPTEAVNTVTGAKGAVTEAPVQVQAKAADALGASLKSPVEITDQGIPVKYVGDIGEQVVAAGGTIRNINGVISTPSSPQNSIGPPSIENQVVASQAVKPPSFFEDVSKGIKENPVLGPVYDLGKSFGQKGTVQKVSDLLESAPVLSTVFLGGRIFEGRQDVAKAEQNYQQLLQGYKDSGLIDKDYNFTGTPDQYSSLMSAKSAADVAAANQQRLEAPTLGSQNAPITMPFADWAHGASEMIRSSADSLIKGADSIVPAAAPLTHGLVGVGEGVAALVPFAALVPPAIEWAARNPGAAAVSLVPGLAMQAETMIGQAREDLPRFGGNIAGMVVAGKVAGDIYGTFPYRLKYGEFRLPIETPEGLPKTQTVNAGYNRILESVKENGIETYNRAALGEPQNYILRTREIPVQYSATWKGIYLDVQGQTKILGITLSRGSPYEGKYGIAGIGSEAGGQFLGAMRSRPYIGPVIEAGVNLPGVRSAVGVIERSPSVPTGLWVGPQSVREFGANVKPRISGAIDFLSDGLPETSILKLQAASAVLPPGQVEVVRSIINLRDVTQRYPGLISVKEPYGKVTPVSMKQGTYEQIIEYMNANPSEMRAYGSLVGRSYHGEYGRASLGDVDALLKSATSQKHSEAMWEIYLKNEFGEGNYQVSRTERVFSTRTESGAQRNIPEVLLEARSPSGQLLSKLETVPSQITETRITGTTPTGAHALDLHPISNLKYNVKIPGLDVRTIPIEDLIWGKQTIGSPPIGTVIVKRAGADVVVEQGGRVKDFFDTYAFARTAAADAYLNPRIALSDAIKLEQASEVLGRRISAVAGTEPNIAKFMSEMRDPFTVREVQTAKMTKVLGAAGGSNKLYSGLPMDEYTISDSVGSLTDRISRYAFAGPVATSEFAIHDRYSVSLRDYTARLYDAPDTHVSGPSLVSPYESRSVSSIISRAAPSYAEVPYTMPSRAGVPWTHVSFARGLQVPYTMPSRAGVPSNARVSGPLGYSPSLADIPYPGGYPGPSGYGPSLVNPLYTLKYPPYTPTGTPPYSPPGYPLHTPPNPPYSDRTNWQRSKRKKLPARFLELFSFEEGIDTPIPRRFGLGGLTPLAVARNPKALFVEGHRGRAKNILHPEDRGPSNLFDILDRGIGRGKGRTRPPVWSRLLS